MTGRGGYGCLSAEIRQLYMYGHTACLIANKDEGWYTAGGVDEGVALSSIHVLTLYAKSVRWPKRQSTKSEWPKR